MCASFYGAHVPFDLFFLSLLSTLPNTLNEDSILSMLSQEDILQPDLADN